MQDRQVGSNSFDKPFVSFCISCYKQEQYIADALAGAFSQTYDNMEIVISDDCSPDGTVDVIKREIEKYNLRGGGHPITLNVNEKNLGNLGNWIKMGEIAKGELLIKADGDDISLPERTAKVVEAWVKDGKRAMVVSHGALKFKDDGTCLGKTNVVNVFNPQGCCQAYAKKCWTAYPFKVDLSQSAIDDLHFMIRALAIGGKHDVCIPDVLVLYRMGSGISTSGTRKKFANKAFPFSLTQALTELEKAKSLLNQEYYEIAKSHGKFAMNECTMRYLIYGGKTIQERLRGVKMSQTRGVKAAIVKFFFLLPPFLGDLFLVSWEKFKTYRKCRQYTEKITDFAKIPERYKQLD